MAHACMEKWRSHLQSGRIFSGFSRLTVRRRMEYGGRMDYALFLVGRFAFRGAVLPTAALSGAASKHREAP